MSMCTCPKCAAVFTSVTAFDQHLDKDYARTPPIICRAPAEAGLIQGNDGRWHVPLSEAGARRLANLRASGSPARVT
jgi:hypothetical protein